MTGCKSAPESTSSLPPMEIRIEKVLNWALENEDALLRIHALESLAEWGQNRHALPVRKALDDPSPAVRMAAAVAAGDLEDKIARDKLYKLLKDENPSVKLAAGYALEKLGDNRFDKWYDKVLTGSDEHLTSLACILLGKLGADPPRQDSIDKLWYVFNLPDQKPAVRLQAAESLARLGDREILKKLLIYANSIYADDRILAVSGLELLGGQDAAAMLNVLSDDPQIEVRLAAIRALGSMADEIHQQQARDALKYTDPDGDPVDTARVRSLAVLALGRVGTDDDGKLIYDAMNASPKKYPYYRVAAARAAIDYIKRMQQRNPAYR